MVVATREPVWAGLSYAQAIAGARPDLALAGGDTNAGAHLEIVDVIVAVLVNVSTTTDRILGCPSVVLVPAKKNRR